MCHLQNSINRLLISIKECLNMALKKFNHQHIGRVKALPSRIRNESKRTVKYLGVCRNPHAYCTVVKSAPDSVIKTICNAALNVQRGGRINLNKTQRSLFSHHRREIAKLVSRETPISAKRKIISQRGGFAWIPALIGAAVGGLGSLLFGGNKSS